MNSSDKLIHALARQNRLMQDFVNRGFGIRAGAIATAVFRQNFRLSGFQNGRLEKWKPARRTLTPSHRAASQYKTLLSARNHLFSSFRTHTTTAAVSITNTAHYAAVHNQGLRAGRGRGFTMPRRRFMGESHELNSQVETMIEQQISKILQL